MCSETANYTNMYPNLQMTNVSQNLQIYISNVSAQKANDVYIKSIFHNLNIGDIKHLNFVKNNDSNSYTCYITMARWYNNISVEHLQEKILDVNQEAIIVHDDPMYWNVHQNETITDKIYELQDQYNIMGYTISQMQKDIEQLYTLNQNTKKNSVAKKCNIYNNNSCCGAVSDAWNPMGEPSN